MNFFNDGATSSRTQSATCLRHRAAQRRRRRHGDLALIGQDDRCPSAPRRWRRNRPARPESGSGLKSAIFAKPRLAGRRRCRRAGGGCRFGNEAYASCGGANCCGMTTGSGCACRGARGDVLDRFGRLRQRPERRSCASRHRRPRSSRPAMTTACFTRTISGAIGLCRKLEAGGAFSVGILPIKAPVQARHDAEFGACLSRR